MIDKSTKISIRTGSPPADQLFTYLESTQHVLQLIDKAEYTAAAAFAQQIATALPNDATSRLLAAQALIQDRRPQDAIELTDEAINLLDDPSPAHIFKARIALLLNDLREVRKQLKKALECNDSSSALQCEYGAIHLAMGDIGKARECFTRGMKLDFRNVSNLLELSQLPDQDIPEDTLKRMEFLVQSKQLSVKNQIAAHFSLAYIYDGRGDISNHFRHLNAGNNLSEKSYNYTSQESKNYISKIIKVFSQDFFQKYPPITQHPDKIIFIIGLPRSGSTLIEQILCAHPSVCDAGENYFSINAIGNFSKRYSNNAKFPNIFTAENYEKLPTLADDYIRYLTPFRHSEVVVDKTLWNFTNVGVISQIFPNAKFVHVKRHPVATLYGCYKRLFARGNITWSYNLDHLAEYYKEYVRLMAHWEKTLPEKIFTLEYESMIADQEKATRDLLGHCEIPWDDRCLKFHENKRSVLTSSNAQVKQKLYTSAVDKWKEYAEYLGPLTDLIEEP